MRVLLLCCLCSFGCAPGPTKAQPVETVPGPLIKGSPTPLVEIPELQPASDSFRSIMRFAKEANFLLRFAILSLNREEGDFSDPRLSRR